jgi:hypothetical protein
MRKFIFGFLLLQSIILSAQQEKKIQALHVIDFTSDKKLELLAAQLPGLSEMGVNMLFLEVDYNFEFVSHPELIENNEPITLASAKRFGEQCKKNNIRLVPQFQMIGHQSWAGNTWAFLRMHPELDLTPGYNPKNDSLYCREWDFTNPKVNEIIFPMVDEITDAFGVDGIHLGMDELFLIGDKHSPSTFGKDPAKLFAIAINEFHDHFVKDKKLEMFMWGDRLINSAEMNYGVWEASAEGTDAAIDMIPKDIVICDWHYNSRTSYPSVDLFIEKGFKVLPSSFKDVQAAKDLIKYSYSLQNPLMAGHIFTTWGNANKDNLPEFEAMVEGIKAIKEEKFYDVKASYLSPSKAHQIVVKLSANNSALNIYYTLDGSTPNSKSKKYKEPIVIDKSCTLQAQSFNGEITAGSILTEDYVLHKGVGLPITLENEPSSKYPANNGKETLLNGIGGSASFSDGEWVAWEGKDMIATINYEKDSIAQVTLTFYNQVGSWIHHPQHIEIYVSEDGTNFQKIAEKTFPLMAKQMVTLSIPFAKTKTKFIKIKASKLVIPEGFNGEGNLAWIFLDEIIIE